MEPGVIADDVLLSEKRWTPLGINNKYLIYSMLALCYC